MVVVNTPDSPPPPPHPRRMDVMDFEWSPPSSHSSPSESPSRRMSNMSLASSTSSPISISHVHPESILSEPRSNHSLFSLAHGKSYLHQSQSSPASRSSSPSPTSATADDDENVEIDPYRILGIDTNTTQDEIIRSYRRLALLSHPHRSSSMQVDKKLSKTDENDSNLTMGSNHETSPGLEITEEQIREWHFIVVAACYETLSLLEYKNKYDAIRKRQSQTILSNDISKIRRRKGGLWLTLKRGLDMTDSFDKNAKDDDLDCCTGDTGPSLLNVCCYNNQKPSKTIKKQQARNDPDKAVSKLQSTRGGQRLLLDLKPLLLSEDEDIQHERSIGTESACHTEEDFDGEFVREETSKLFGGRLAVLYRARNYQPFSDPYCLFRQEFGSDIFKSCFDYDDDEHDQSPSPSVKSFNDISQEWVSGGNGRILDDSLITEDALLPDEQQQYNQHRHISNMSPFTHSTSHALSYSKPNLVYPVLLDIPMHILQRYGVLDGRTRMNRVQDIKTMKKRSSPIVSTKVRRENKNGIDAEVKTTTRIQNNTRIIRTQTTTIDPDSAKKTTVTVVKKENIPINDTIPEKPAVNPKNECTSTSFFDRLVPCCSYQIPHSPPHIIVHDDDSTVSSQSTIIAGARFEDKGQLRVRMKKLFSKRKLESRQDSI
mmetsp:Transcript_10243/g.12959  ORF Transcript_10243/g.12959 Transcript_10243/m.12959 type:complete len:657 (-) Transcript_10243:118-2088(-)